MLMLSTDGTILQRTLLASARRTFVSSLLNLLRSLSSATIRPVLCMSADKCVVLFPGAEQASKTFQFFSGAKTCAAMQLPNPLTAKTIIENDLPLSKTATCNTSAPLCTSWSSCSSASGGNFKTSGIQGHPVGLQLCAPQRSSIREFKTDMPVLPRCSSWWPHARRSSVY